LTNTGQHGYFDRLMEKDGAVARLYLNNRPDWYLTVTLKTTVVRQKTAAVHDA